MLVDNNRQICQFNIFFSIRQCWTTITALQRCITYEHRFFIDVWWDFRKPLPGKRPVLSTSLWTDL